MFPSFPLDNGVSIPQLGLGVYQVPPGEETVRAVRDALDLGYRHIDTARWYSNERDVGRAVRASGIPRDQIFVTTKLANPDHGFASTIKACEESLKLMGFDYVDLYLIHWPVARLRGDSWRAMEKLYKEGKCKTIGVSNYMIHHCEELLKNCEVVPHVNQVELHPFLTHEKLRAYSAEKKIQIETYCPLTQGLKLNHKIVLHIANKNGRTSAQVMLRWAVQLGLVVIPKSLKKERMEENSKIFDWSLDQDDMHRLNGLNEELHVSWDPTHAP
jgi:diketogulonate reductase-like aldo/keto reductase